MSLVFDSNLNFKPQIDALIKKCNFSLYRMNQIEKGIPRKELIACVQSEIMTRLLVQKLQNHISTSRQNEQTPVSDGTLRGS